MSIRSRRGPESQLAAVSTRKRSRAGGLLSSLVILVAALVVASHAQSLSDWWRLRDYQAPAPVSALADETMMTPYARHLFYLNKPDIAGKADFRNDCPDYGEKTIVLGCYHGVQHGIYVLSVDDSRLDGVEQVTAAHEMLHAAYDRLSSQERKTIDQELQDFADHQLNDQRVKTTLDGYRKTEPGQVINEMHSIFGTEVSNLTPALEAYYSRYFTKRTAVTADAARYQAAFTDRQAKVAQYDAELKSANQQIQANLQTLDNDNAALNSAKDRLDALRSSGDIDGYNAGVIPYNNQVTAYNTLLATTRQQIAEYNQKVDVRNEVAAETTQLTQAISSSVLPAQQ